MSANTNEISIESINHACCEDRPEKILFLSQSVVSCLFTSSNNFSWLVPAVEIDDLPDGKKGVWDNHLDEWCSHKASSAMVVFVKPFDLETGSDNSWDQKKYTDKDIPPMDKVIENKVEDLNKTWDNQEFS